MSNTSKTPNISATRSIGFDAGHRVYRSTKSEYKVYPDGRVWSSFSKRYLKPSIDKDGYRIVNVGSKVVKLHRLVATVFYGSKDSSVQVRHLDGNPANNNVENLAWGTAQENWEDRRKHVRGIGEEHGSAKLNEDQVKFIRSYPKGKTHLKELSEKFGVSRILISKIRQGKIWRHI